jgi:hypothetical protein
MYKYLPAKVEKISVLRIFREKIRGILWQIAGVCVPLHSKKRFTNYLYYTSMKKKQYEKPSIEVVELKQTRMLMASGDAEDYQFEPEREW